MTNVLDRLSPGFQAISAMFAAASLDLAGMLAKGPDSLKQHIEAMKNSGDVSAAVEAATSQLQAQLTSATGKVTAFEAALTKFGATIKAADEKAGVTSADIETALKTRASIMAGEQLAKHGLPTAIALTPAGDATQPAVKAVAKTDAEHLAHYESLDPDSAARRDYGAKHFNAIRRADVSRDHVV